MTLIIPTVICLQNLVIDDYPPRDERNDSNHVNGNLKF